MSRTLEVGQLRRRDFGARIASAAIAAVGTRLIRSNKAHATHVPPPAGCYGFNVCHCCGSGTCGSVRADFGCPSGTGCWYYYQESPCRTYKCCDYLYGGEPCLCRLFVSNSC